MKISTHKFIPKILGAGLVCLDIIKTEESVRYINGGSCGNVISALSFLGFESSVITRNYMDKAGEVVKANLTQVGVKQFKTDNKPSITPRIIENLISDSEGAYIDHKFLFECPECNKKLPSFKSFTEKAIRPLVKVTNNFNVFYSDRSSPGINYLRNIFKGRGDWTIYEPDNARNFSTFINSSLNSSIVKFSDERISFHIANKLREIAVKGSTLLIVQTKGKNGLIFSYRKRDQKMSKWIHLDSQPIPNFVDAAGAGDWCTAGLIIGLTNKTSKAKNCFIKEELISVLQYGQALSAISCAFAGSQGLIYADDKTKKQNNLLNKIKTKEIEAIKPVSFFKDNSKALCLTCLQ